MFEERRPKNWSQSYWDQVKRNIGLVSLKEQECLREAQIAVLGQGGLGGPLTEQLARSGCENFVICDNDKFDESNLNRQVCVRADIGKFKVDVVEKLLKNINPEIKVCKYYEVNELNVLNIINRSSVVVLALDDIITSILISRKCREKKILLLEAWAVPYIWAWWFTSESEDYETCYGFKTKNMTISKISQSKSLLLDLKKQLLNKLMQFPGIIDRYDREKGVFEEIRSGKRPFVSLAPIIRIAASYLAFEVIFSGILKIKKMTLAPQIIGYDYFKSKIIKFKF